MRKFLAAAVSFIDTAVKKGAEIIGVAAARYRKYVDEANAEAQKEAKVRDYNILASNSRPDYELVAEMLVEVINNTVEETHLHPVSDIRKLFCNPWLCKVKGGFFVFVYHAWYAKGFGITANDVRRILQSELDRLCDVYEYPRLVVHVTFGADGAVKIQIAYFNDAKTVKKVII